MFFVTKKGIGRVAQHTLLPFLHRSQAPNVQLDLEDVNLTFLQQAKQAVSAAHVQKAQQLQLQKNININLSTAGLQEFTPAANTYDLIWIQWVIIYLTDDDLVAFLKRCTAALKQQQQKPCYICIKENYISNNDKFIIDEDDSSIIRTDAHMRELFARASLKVAHAADQVNFPAELFKVKMYALQPM